MSIAIVQPGDQTEAAQAGADKMHMGVKQFNDGFLELGAALKNQRLILTSNQAYGKWLDKHDYFGFGSVRHLNRIQSAYTEAVRTSSPNGSEPYKIEKLAKAHNAHIRETRAAGDTVQMPTTPGDWTNGRATVLHGDFRERLTDPNLQGTVDLIFTDPPYPKDDLDLYRDVAETASSLLNERGLLAVYAGNFYIPEVIGLMQQGGMTYGWTYCLLMDSGSQSRIMGRHIMQAWKPVFVFTKGTWPSAAWHTDTISSAGRDKDLYEWQQDAVAAQEFINRLAPANGLVVDPFLGVGTSGVAALRAGRQFIGVELDEGRTHTAIERMNNDNT